MSNLNEIRVHCYLVKNGCKPAAVTALQTRYIDEAIEICQLSNIKYHFSDLSKDWVSFFVYKYDHILEVIKNSPEKPNSTYDHWILGKLFGYDEQAIGDFVNVLS
jgi:hypothetical protein